MLRTENKANKQGYQDYQTDIDYYERRENNGQSDFLHAVKRCELYETAMIEFLHRTNTGQVLPQLMAMYETHQRFGGASVQDCTAHSLMIADLMRLLVAMETAFHANGTTSAPLGYGSHL